MAQLNPKKGRLPGPIRPVLSVAFGVYFLFVTGSLRAQTEPRIVNVEGGTFRMGISETSIAELRRRYGIHFPGSFENETPARTVTLSAFQLDAHELTNRRFAEFVKARPQWRADQIREKAQNGDYLKHWENGGYLEGLGEHPVMFVTWHAALEFCRWSGGRLPTEAEWEFAARAGGTQEFPWGDELPSPERANYGATGKGKTTPVGTYPGNAFGLYDLAGNVWEWIYDEWRDDYSGTDSNQINPLARGGSVD